MVYYLSQAYTNKHTTLIIIYIYNNYIIIEIYIYNNKSFNKIERVKMIADKSVLYLHKHSLTLSLYGLPQTT